MKKPSGAYELPEPMLSARGKKMSSKAFWLFIEEVNDGGRAYNLVEMPNGELNNRRNNRSLIVFSPPL